MHDCQKWRDEGMGCEDCNQLIYRNATRMININNMKYRDYTIFKLRKGLEDAIQWMEEHGALNKEGSILDDCKQALVSPSREEWEKW